MIKDTTQLQGFGNIKLPKIKGTVEIRLHNPTTGKTEIQRGENMVTNAVSDIFASNYCGAMNYRKLLPLYSKMYGGILCFSKALDTSSQDTADDYFIPDADPTNGNPVTAHAGQTTLTDQTDDYTRGNPSAGNVDIKDGKVTLAWEWGISAGNGTISSLALTHADVGDAGTGSTSQAFSTMIPVINANFTVSDADGLQFSHTNSQQDNMVMFVDNNGYGYRFTTSDTTVTITRIPFAYNSVGLVGNIFIDSDLNTTKNVTVTTDFDENTPYYYFDKLTSKLWLFYNTSLSRNVKIEEIDLSNWSSITVTNHDMQMDSDSTKVGPLYNSFFGPQSVPMYIIPQQNNTYKKYVYLPKIRTGGSVAYGEEASGCVKMDLNSTSDQTAMTANFDHVGGSFSPNVANRILVGKSFVVNNDVIYPTAIDTIDALNRTSPQNLNTYPFMNSKVGLANLGGRYRYNTYGLYYTAASKFYLGTKYNLSTAVVKSPSQSMIVTYTLEEVSE